jgi:hypothetical protein
LQATLAGDLVTDSRAALIVASDSYQDPGLRRLRAPAADIEALARVLGAPEISGFTVQSVLNEPRHVVEEAIESLFADSQRGDMCLLYYDNSDDLAVSAPWERVGTANQAGAVSILYGSAGGLTTAGGQLFTQVAGTVEATDQFGGQLAAGDFNNNGLLTWPLPPPSSASAQSSLLVRSASSMAPEAG